MKTNDLIRGLYLLLKDRTKKLPIQRNYFTPPLGVSENNLAMWVRFHPKSAEFWYRKLGGIWEDEEKEEDEWDPY